MTETPVTEPTLHEALAARGFSSTTRSEGFSGRTIMRDGVALFTATAGETWAWLKLTRSEVHSAFVESVGSTIDAMEFENTVIGAIGFDKLPSFARVTLGPTAWRTDSNDDAIAYWAWLTEQHRTWKNGGAS